jgi:ferredoxin
VLKKSGRRILIPADRSILETLTEQGVAVPSSCQGGICGTCETTVSSGHIEHRDFVLMADEQDAHNKMMICVSRAQDDELVLDL